MGGSRGAAFESCGRRPMDPLFPMRCMSCGKVLGNKSNAYWDLRRQGVEAGQACREIGLTRVCCIVEVKALFVPNAAARAFRIDDPLPAQHGSGARRFIKAD
jgi:DNA-directed RNA polymerase subunit N (RpoN/RPB10)